MSSAQTSSLEDLNPKTFVRKHLLSEEDEAALRKPLQSIYDDVRNDAKHVRDAVDLNTPLEPPHQQTAVTRASYDDAT